VKPATLVAAVNGDLVNLNIPAASVTKLEVLLG